MGRKTKEQREKDKIEKDLKEEKARQWEIHDKTVGALQELGKHKEALAYALYVIKARE